MKYALNNFRYGKNTTLLKNHKRWKNTFLKVIRNKHPFESHKGWTPPLNTTKMKKPLLSHTRDKEIHSLKPQGMNMSFESHKGWPPPLNPTKDEQVYKDNNTLSLKSTTWWNLSHLHELG